MPLQQTRQPPKTYYKTNLWWLPAALAGAVLCGIVLMPLVTLIQQFSLQDGLAVLSQAYTWRVVKFSFWQAALSTLLSLFFAALMAVALARQQHFPARDTLLKLFSIPLVMPTLVAITGLIIVFGRNGWLSEALQSAGWDGNYRFYGISGILLAHVFLNFPLATRIFLQSIESIPAENWKLAGQFGIHSVNQFRWLELAAIRRVLPQAGVLIFSLCFTSFAVVLTLGGGPAASTIEVAIYQALRLDFDIPVAVVLALLQIIICGIILLLNAIIGKPAVFSGFTVNIPYRHWQKVSSLNGIMIAIGMSFIFSPLLAIVIRGVNIKTLDVISNPLLWKAAWLSVSLGIASGLLAVGLATGLLLSSRHLQLRIGSILRGRLVASLGLMTLLVPSVVLSAGLFLWLHEYLDVFASAGWLLVAVNALVTMPFAIATLADPMMTIAERNDRLCAALGIYGRNRLRFIEWQLLRSPLGLSLGLCSAMAAGDLTAIALFGSQDFLTLPLLLYQWLGSYRMAEASVAAVILLLSGLLLFAFFDWLLAGKKHVEN